MDRTYLITGGAGNLARQLAELLVGPSTRIVLFDRTAAPTTLPRAESVTGDITDLAGLRALFQRVRPTHVVHMASLLSGSSEADRQAAWAINATSSFQMMELSVEFKVAQFFFPSTSATYGGRLPNPVPEDFPQWPENLYGATKVGVERLGAYFHSRQGLDFRGIRMPLIVSRHAPASATSAYGSHVFIEAVRRGTYVFPVTPDVRISTIYVKDVVRGMKALLEAPAANLTRRIYNLHGISPSAGELAALVQRLVPGFTFSFAPDPMIMRIAQDWPVRLVDDSARRDWGWKPTLDLEALAVDFLKEIRAAG